MSNRNHTSSGGIGFTGALLLIFITLKLTDNIDWSRVWVLSPFWIPLGLVAAIAIVVGIAWAITSVAETISRRRALSRAADAVNRAEAQRRARSS